VPMCSIQWSGQQSAGRPAGRGRRACLRLIRSRGFCLANVRQSILGRVCGSVGSRDE
jgi:hypothetical protein